MGFKQAAVLASVSFFLGVLFICFNVDHKLLWTELTEETVNDGFQFYTTFFTSPPAIKALLHGMVGVGLIGLLSKLHQWDESAMFFDGSSLVAYVFAIAVYITVTIPTLRTIATPLSSETQDMRIEAIRVLSAGNVIMMIALTGVLVLQGGQEYARRLEARARTKVETEEQHKERVEKKLQ
ncbi:hypothetical protein AMATHDRAFT_70626 [Amanita thiersii Skay4041]|uniref:Shr3 amino acid permease chaperone n=1 Tax=Amanita thiersii Skay4041 TaxID=703135 RepID=A0A2A9NEP2_9AGAR|nr:hypothetical protein AMATHDRAFT_70626 [Amanita thiersii Skay4041]